MDQSDNLEFRLCRPANYIHNSGDKEPVIILGYDGKGRAWVKWCKDDFINMVDVERLKRPE